MSSDATEAGARDDEFAVFFFLPLIAKLYKSLRTLTFTQKQAAFLNKRKCLRLRASQRGRSRPLSWPWASVHVVTYRHLSPDEQPKDTSEELVMCIGVGGGVENEFLRFLLKEQFTYIDNWHLTTNNSSNILLEGAHAMH